MPPTRRVYWPSDRIRSLAEAQAAKDDISGEEMLEQSFGDGVEPEAYWARGPDEPAERRILSALRRRPDPAGTQAHVEFLNEQMDPAEVLALEIKQYVNAAMHTFVPRVFGQTAVVKGGAPSRGSTSSRFRRTRRQMPRARCPGCSEDI